VKPFATFLENKYGNLIEKEINKTDIQTFIEINETNIANGKNIVSKLVYLRRIYEITNLKGMGYHLVSNIFHKRTEPEIYDTALSRSMTQDEVVEGTNEIRQKILDFDYTNVIALVSDNSKMKNLYKQSSNNYEKLHIYRIFFAGSDESIQSDVIKKFINQAFHIENDYIYQLNPAMFQTVPHYIIDECNKYLGDE
jgi:hypothetical protein